MVDERESPSTGWREVYREMATDSDAEEATCACPDCGRSCENLIRDVYECEEHGVFRASASTADGEESTKAIDETDVGVGEAATDDAGAADDTKPAADASDESDPVENRAREPAD
jgi:hypothetical protein